jgi:hypothetical protein
VGELEKGLVAKESPGLGETDTGESEIAVEEDDAGTADTSPVEDIVNGAASSRGFAALLCAYEAPVTNNTSPQRNRTCRIAQTPR